MNYEAKLINISEEIEEEVEIRVAEINITCFATYCPYAMQIGSNYLVELDIFIINEYKITERSAATVESIQNIPGSLSSIITGVVSKNTITAKNITFRDETLSEEFSHLDGKIVSLKVDRIDASFIQELGT